jgi:hypothetical protein
MDVSDVMDVLFTRARATTFFPRNLGSVFLTTPPRDSARTLGEEAGIRRDIDERSGQAENQPVR